MTRPTYEARVADEEARCEHGLTWWQQPLCQHDRDADDCLTCWCDDDTRWKRAQDV